MLAEIFFLGIVLYLLYKFVFNFFLPIFRTTRHVHQQFKNMQESRPGQQNEPPPSPKRPEPSSSKNTMGEYIDFEEVK